MTKVGKKIKKRSKFEPVSHVNIRSETGSKVFIFLLLLFAGLGLARAGDLFLSFVGDKLHIKIAYKNHSGFISCFALRFIELDNPSFTLKDFDLTLRCKKAFIEPDFRRLWEKKAIVLKCTLWDASFSSQKESIDEKGLLSPLLNKLSNIFYEMVYTEIEVYNDRIRFPFYEAHSRVAKLYASGSITHTGDFDISVKGFVSPEIAKGAPEELIAMLTPESRGWMSQTIHFESDRDKSSFKLESDRLRIDIKKVEKR